VLVEFRWRQGPTSPVHLRTYTNAATEIEKLFRLYEARPTEPFTGNPEAIEDFTWVLGNRLRENIWTSFSPQAEPTWDALEAREDVEETPIPKGSGFYVLIQPTMDKPSEETEKASEDAPNTHVVDLTGAGAATPLGRITEGMLVQNTLIALVPPESVQDLPSDALGGTLSVMARISPRPELAVDTVYLRFVRQNA